MGLILSIKEMNNIPPLEDGTYTGTLIGIVEMGEQLGFEKKRYRPTIQFTFEVYGEFIDRGNGDEAPLGLCGAHAQPRQEQQPAGGPGGAAGPAADRGGAWSTAT